MRFYSFSNIPHFIFRFVVSLILLSNFHSRNSNVFSADEGNGTVIFSYDEATGRGPSRWATLKESWYHCGNGTRQSPTNINDLTVQYRPGNLQTDYKPAPATLYNRGNDIEVQWNDGSDAGKLTINEVEYKLEQCHWHTPAEHTLNGLRFAMEIHLVHQNSIGERAVLGIVYKYGRPDPFLSMLYQQILSLRNDTRMIPLGIVDPTDIESPGFSRKYYRYNGSLTTPPCSENVLWTVLKRVQTVSLEQVQALKEAVDDGFQENARPTQPLNGSPVSLYFPWFF